jgi:hypothetical protein
MTENEIPSLTELLTSTLDQCHERGMPLPYLLVMAGINGLHHGSPLCPVG